ASVSSLPQYLPAYAGFLLEEEISTLTQALNDPARPLVSITGGIKISSKVKLIENLLKKSDNVLVGGKIANTILTVKGICVRDKWTDEERMLEEFAGKINLTSPKLHLPVDGVISLIGGSDEDYSRIGAVGTVRSDEDIFDIGPETVEKFKAVINEARTIIWNGPLGYIEREDFREGTKEIIKAIAKSPAYSIVGGGETVETIRQEKMENGFDYISTGGGAMLDFISGVELPGLKALENN
ncbi:MAG: phosphoglycerate kinase, partial [Candidatus Pacebacteria bacterium]|nr:phosphoglycerate kinase [Candidatus Paceibacterota bacterium]